MNKFLLGAGAALLLATTAQANITPVLVSTTASGSNFLYTYQVTLDSDQGLVPGAKMAIYDFAGYIPGSVTSSSGMLIAGTEFVSTTGLLVNPGYNDDAGIINLTLTSNATYNASNGPFPETQFTLTALSTFNTTQNDGYSSGAVKNNGTAMGPTFNVGPVEVPFAAVPEPTTWGLMILGFGGVGAMIRRRKTGEAFAAA
jgi:hypothetical protein